MNRVTSIPATETTATMPTASVKGAGTAPRTVDANVVGVAVETAFHAAFAGMDTMASGSPARFGTDFRGRISRPEAELRNRKVAFPASWKRAVRLALPASLEARNATFSDVPALAVTALEWRAIAMGARVPVRHHETRLEFSKLQIEAVRGIPQHALNAGDLRSSKLVTRTATTYADLLRSEILDQTPALFAGVSRVHRAQVGARLLSLVSKETSNERSRQIGGLCQTSPSFRAFTARNRAARNLARTMAKLAKKLGDKFAPGIYGNVAVWRLATTVQRCPVAKRGMILALRHHHTQSATYARAGKASTYVYVDASTDKPRDEGAEKTYPPINIGEVFAKIEKISAPPERRTVDV